MNIDRDRTLLGWHLTPFYAEPLCPNEKSSGLSTACVVSCIATGKMLDGMGGPGYALSPEVVASLDQYRKPKGGAVYVIEEKHIRNIASLATKVKDEALLKALQAMFKDAGLGVPGIDF